MGMTIDVIRLNAGDGDVKCVRRDLNLKTLMNDLCFFRKIKDPIEIRRGGCLRYFSDILSDQILHFEFLISPFAAAAIMMLMLGQGV